MMFRRTQSAMLMLRNKNPIDMLDDISESVHNTISGFAEYIVCSMVTTVVWPHGCAAVYFPRAAGDRQPCQSVGVSHDGC